MVAITRQTTEKKTTYLSNRSLDYIVIHYTAGVTSKKGSAANVAAYFRDSNADASADFIVDDSTIVQYNPDIKNRYCWSVGGGRLSTKGGRLYGKATNRNTINIEVCSSNSAGRITSANDQYFYFTDAAVKNAVELTKYLMKQYGIPVSNVIRHYDVTGKICPGVRGWNADSGNEQKWQEFKNALVSSSKPAKKDDGNVIKAVNYTVKVEKTIALYKYAGNANKIGTVPKGVYTIVKEANNFGYLKSGAGWIYLKNCEPVQKNTTMEQKKTIKVGSVVKVKPGTKDYDKGRQLADFVYKTNYYVTEIKGKRAVIAVDSFIVAAVNIDNLILVN